MGKGWDKSGIAYDVDLWKEVFRVLKPGGHLLSFGGSRTYRRMACAIEDAGFEIRDQIMWVYGSGFPKSMDIAKAIDKEKGYVGTVIGSKEVDKGIQSGSLHAGRTVKIEMVPIRELSNSAEEWDGWGTALKPAHEPICVARKPISEKTVASNVLKYGTGALNINSCRVETDEIVKTHSRGAVSAKSKGKYGDSKEQSTFVKAGQDIGRFPANLIHDGSDEVIESFPEAKGQQGASSAEPLQTGHIFGNYDKAREVKLPRNDKDTSAARFFYCAKASKSDRGAGNDHTTVKPMTLMRYLVRLVCPPGGTVLDPFAGSGTTCGAAELEGFRAVGIEKELPHVKIIGKRYPEAEILADGELFDVEFFNMLY